jgi:hypothetical protein
MLKPILNLQFGGLGLNNLEQIKNINLNNNKKTQNIETYIVKINDLNNIIFEINNELNKLNEFMKDFYYYIIYLMQILTKKEENNGITFKYLNLSVLNIYSKIFDSAIDDKYIQSKYKIIFKQAHNLIKLLITNCEDYKKMNQIKLNIPVHINIKESKFQQQYNIFDNFKNILRSFWYHKKKNNNNIYKITQYQQNINFNSIKFVEDLSIDKHITHNNKIKLTMTLLKNDKNNNANYEYIMFGNDVKMGMIVAIFLYLKNSDKKIIFSYQNDNKKLEFYYNDIIHLHELKNKNKNRISTIEYGIAKIEFYYNDNADKISIACEDIK